MPANGKRPSEPTLPASLVLIKDSDLRLKRFATLHRLLGFFADIVVNPIEGDGSRATLSLRRLKKLQKELLGRLRENAPQLDLWG